MRELIPRLKPGENEKSTFYKKALKHIGHLKFLLENLMRRLISALVLTNLLVVSPLGYAQRTSDKSKKTTAVNTTAQRGVDTISASQMKEYLTFIASDEMEGRDTPSRGLDTTAKFIAMNLARWGFKPAGDNGTFLQRIDLKRDRVQGAQTRVELNGRVLTPELITFP